MKKIGGIVMLGIMIFMMSMFLPSLVTLGQGFLPNVPVNDGMEDVAVDGENQNEVIDSEGLDLEDTGSDVESENEEQMDSTVEEIELETSQKSDEVKTVYPNNGHKKVFLTFDDGPTPLTPRVLDILKEENVPATFFIIGRLLEKYPQYTIRAYEEGHGILPHSYSHDYSIYSTFETFYDDFYKAEQKVKETLGYEPPPIFRFPGGSSNHSSFDYGGKQFMPKLTEDIKEKGYYYVDWNASSGDAGPDYDNPDQMLKNVLEGAAGKDFVVVLFHDVTRNEKMLEMLPKLIETLKKDGYTFRSFRDITEEELDKMVQLKLANKPIIR
ncbi:polysaccharide deacetylase [Alkaliphilus metalliredigens QYMF]|uniref:Polysaccharide deacetylase n=1 Tax=Alkaliphilus metalliredigens (strain QYMF) TaxID=293826 RepID=A6TNW9_ALKMQ|nr:polysaccharide deacetylase family protein [Alkaliphilus metalliredigens]ABR47887.1 polysaccharide deacetylase [Alkaliphilus metalliredigens QYMF]